MVSFASGGRAASPHYRDIKSPLPYQASNKLTCILQAGPLLLPGTRLRPVKETPQRPGAELP